MKVRIKSVSPFAEYDGLVYSYKVVCFLNNGRELTFIDEKPFDLTEFIDKLIRIKLSTSFIFEKKDCDYSFEGLIEFSSSFNKYYFINEEIKVFLSKDNIDVLNINLNEKKEYCFEDFILNDFNTESPQL